LLIIEILNGGMNIKLKDIELKKKQNKKSKKKSDKESVKLFDQSSKIEPIDIDHKSKVRPMKSFSMDDSTIDEIFEEMSAKRTSEILDSTKIDGRKENELIDFVEKYIPLEDQKESVTDDSMVKVGQLVHGEKTADMGGKINIKEKLEETVSEIEEIDGEPEGEFKTEDKTEDNGEDQVGLEPLIRTKDDFRTSFSLLHESQQRIREHKTELLEKYNQLVDRSNESLKSFIYFSLQILKSNPVSFLSLNSFYPVLLKLLFSNC